MAQAPVSSGVDAVRELCASLFARPDQVEQLTHHALSRPFEIAPHRHPWMLQFDLILHCGGTATLRDAPASLSRCALMTTYPGTRHGYRLEPASPQAEVFHIKLAARGLGALARARPFPELVTDLPEPAALRRSFDEAVRLADAGDRALALRIVAICRVIALWPTRDTLAGPGAALLGEAIVSGARAEQRAGEAGVLELIESRLADPPSLGELAEASHLSPRHFARRFKSMMGCTPLAYINARRLTAAKAMLQDPETPVADVGRDLGFTSAPAFTRWFKHHAGVSPRAFRADPARM